MTEATDPDYLRRLKAIHPHLADDLDSEAALAALLHARDGAAARRHLAAFARDNSGAAADPDFGGEQTPTAAVSAVARRPLTPGQRRRFRRDLVIQVAHRGGVSQRVLADVFGLPRSRIGTIVHTDLSRKAARR